MSRSVIRVSLCLLLGVLVVLLASVIEAAPREKRKILSAILDGLLDNDGYHHHRHHHHHEHHHDEHHHDEYYNDGYGGYRGRNYYGGGHHHHHHSHEVY